MAREIEYRENMAGNFRLLNFATGSYTCFCSVCKQSFIGDKRAVQCLGCALKLVEEKFTSTNLEKINRWFIAKIDDICYALDPNFIGTWQQRAEHAVLKAKEAQPRATQPCKDCEHYDRGCCVLDVGNHCIHQASDYFTQRTMR